MIDTFFSYGMVTDEDVKFYKAVPGTMKITGIKATDNGVVNIPETIDGLPVTYYAGLSYYGDPIKKLILPKTLVALTSTEYFPEIVGELVVDNDNPKWSTDGVSLLSKDGTRLLRMCQKNRASYTIPDTVKAIGNEAFANCFELEELFLPASCVELGESVLPHATTGWVARSAKFSRIDVDPKNEAFSSLDGVLCSKNGDTLIACPSQYNVADYTIPEGVKEVLPGAFEGCEKIKKVVFAKTVDKIGARAFASMNALEEIVLPPNCPVLGEELFTECANLKFVTWPNNVHEIGVKCFEHTGIENLVIPETVETVGEYAFAFIKAKRVRLPKTIKDISLSIFAGVPEIEVYDTIDSEAKPAAEYLDDMNGGFNGKVGFIGIHQRENYLVAACNAEWHEHTIIVRSAEDDSEKYRVRMPNGQKRKVYCTYASSWGKNAEFNFCAVDNIFKDLTADAKLDYAFNRLHWQAGISEEMLSTLNKFVARNAKDIAARVFKTDAIDDLVMLESFGIVKKNTIDERIDAATKANAMKCKAWLLNWQNSNLSAKEKAAKAEKSLSTGALTVAEIKKIWPNKKGADGGLTITGYNGKDVDVRVPEIIGKTPVTAIAGSCFSDNKDKEQQEFLRTQLRSVEIPDSVVDIGSMAFWYCEGLERVKLPKKIKTITRCLFYKCKNLSIDIPSGITEIQDSAFEGCTMKSITVPASVKAIRETSFGESRGWGAQGMPNLESIEVDPASKYFKSVDGVLFSFDGKTLVKYPQAKTLESYEIPDGVTKISKNAFASVDALKSVTIPESVDAIEDNAFSKCGNLEIVSMPEKVSSFGSAFDGCASLKDIVVPKGVSELPGGCFAGCKSLTKVDLPMGLKKIGFQAFMDCENLSEINVPAAVRGIGEKAFKGCKALKDITISRSTTGIGWDVFGECDNLTIHTPAGSRMYTYAKTEKIKVEELIESTDEEDVPKSKPPKAPRSIEKVPSCWKLRDGWLKNYTGNDRELVIPAKIGSNTVKGLDASLFKDNQLLEKVVISEGIEMIYDNAFRGCTSLSEISFPKSLNDVGNNYSMNGFPSGDTPFHGTPWEKNAGEMIRAGTVLVRYKGKEETVVIPEGIRVIGELSFVKNQNIKSVHLPSTIEVIRRAAFEECNQLDEILLPEGLTTIEAGAFRGCKRLKEVVLPESLKSFGDDYGGGVFEGCIGMKKLVIKGNNPCVMPGQLFGCDFEIELSRSESDSQENDRVQDFSSAEIGEIVLLGHYSEPIEWIVLEKEEDRALLLAKDSVESAEYQKRSSQDKPCTWEKSQIRTWLNGPFYSMVFSEEEKQKIILTTNQTQDNAKSGATGGNDTADKVFLLSEQEVKRYVPKDKRACRCNLPYGMEDCWWTRTPSVNGTQGVVVRSNGSIAQDPTSNIRMFYSWTAAGIRPACWVKL